MKNLLAKHFIVVRDFVPTVDALTSLIGRYLGCPDDHVAIIAATQADEPTPDGFYPIVVFFIKEELKPMDVSAHSS